MKLTSLLSLVTTFLLLSTATWATQHTVSGGSFFFDPDTLEVAIGDTIVFDMDITHNAVEVSEATWNDNGITSNGGFQVPFGGGSIVIEEAKTYYYVCTPHVGLGMKAIIIAREASADQVFVADLSGSQEVLPVLSTGRGSLRAELTGNQLVVTGSFEGLTSDFNAQIQGGVHLHRGYAGSNGGIEVILAPTLDGDNRGGVFVAEDNTFELTAQQLALLQNRQLYINIHTVAHPSGEIRGQLVPEADEVYYVNLFGSNEVPAVMSPGQGALVLEQRGTELVVTGSFAGLGGQYNANIGSHLHQGMAGENGGVVFPLTPSLGAESKSGTYAADANTFSLSAGQQALLERRALYANIHTTLAPGGELRGQVRPASTAVFRTFLAGSNEAPPITSGGGGQLLLELDGDEVTVTGAFTGLEGDLNAEIGGGAHIHMGYTGQNGGVVVPLNTTLEAGNRDGRFEASDNQFELDGDMLNAMLARNFYVNIHSTLHPSGELRGQIVPESQAFFTGFLTGTQEVRPVLTDGFGAVIGEVMGSRLTLSGAFQDLGSAVDVNIGGGAHIHGALAGSNGPVLIPIAPELDEDSQSGVFAAAANAFSLSEGLLDSLLARMFYVNIHTQEVASGELRAQLLPEANAYFLAPLSGASATVPVETSGQGALIAEWNGATLITSGSFNSLSSDLNTDVAGGAHVHVGLPGQNGGIRFPLTVVQGDDPSAGTFPAAENTFAPVAADFADSLRARRFYANIHSLDVPSGELRGNLLNQAVAYFTTSAAGINEVPPVATEAVGSLKLELTGDRLVVVGAFSGLASDFNTNIGAHLHQADASQNGDVVVPLTPTLDADNRAGSFMTADNAFTLDAQQLTALKGEELYLNIHTVDVPSGAIRGQILPETNQFPAATAITGPASDALIPIEGEGSTPFVAQWNPAIDPDGNAPVYIWQLAADADFEAPALSVNVGFDTTFTTDFKTVSDLLMSLGLETGSTVKVYHRVLVSDGSLTTASPTDSVNLSLGTVSFDEVLARQFQVELFPVPATDRLTVSVEAETGAQGQLQLYDRAGRMLSREFWRLDQGGNTHQVDVQRLVPGTYFVQLFIDGQPLRARKIMIQR